MTDQISLKPGAEHFRVDELPAYEPVGDGEHLYIHIQKRDLTTDVAAKVLAEAAGKKIRDLAWAGRKDRHGITRQWLSIHFGDEIEQSRVDEILSGFPGQPELQILEQSRHRNKLRLGHLRGNRFQLGLSGVTAANRQQLQSALTHCQQHGLPNRFGQQRFGLNNSNRVIAQAWARADWTTAFERLIANDGSWTCDQPLPEDRLPTPAHRARQQYKRKADCRRAFLAAGKAYLQLIRNAAQSMIFNAILDGRQAAGLLKTAQIGDLLLDGHRLVEVDADTQADCQQQCDSFTYLCTGPLPGSRVRSCGAAVARQEADWAAASGLDLGAFAADGPLDGPGERRALLYQTLEAIELKDDWLHVALPPGCYATELLEHLGIHVPDQRAGTPPIKQD